MSKSDFVKRRGEKIVPDFSTPISQMSLKPGIIHKEIRHSTGQELSELY